MQLLHDLVLRHQGRGVLGTLDSRAWNVFTSSLLNFVLLRLSFDVTFVYLQYFMIPTRL